VGGSDGAGGLGSNRNVAGAMRLGWAVGQLLDGVMGRIDRQQ
jgi:hypothetical protein